MIPARTIADKGSPFDWLGLPEAEQQVRREIEAARQAARDLRSEYPPPMWPYLDAETFEEIKAADVRIRHAEQKLKLAQAGIPADWTSAAPNVLARLAQAEADVKELAAAVAQLLEARPA